MLAGALCRLAADVPKASPHDMPHLARHLGRALLARNAAESSTARALSRAYAYALCSRRSYATTARATKPAATVKKAVKAASSEKTPPKTKAASATKKTAKKPAAKKRTTKKAAKKPAAKKTASKRVKKPLTEEEKEKLKIRELRAKALKEPCSQNPVSAYNVFVAEFAAGHTNNESQTTRIIEAVKAYKNLTPAQLEHYNHLANEKTAARKAEFEKWLQSYTPDQIRIANLARAQLRRRLAGARKDNRRPAHTAKLHDPRHVKPPLSAYLLFVKARHASGDMKGIPATETTKLIAREWKGLSDSEKKKYEDEAQAAKR